MSLLIKGFKMPKACNAGCPISGLACTAWWESNGGDIPSDCPIIELPDHGDLIEREYAIASGCSGRIRALPTTEDGEDWIRVEEVRQSLKSVLAVITAERSEE